MCREKKLKINSIKNKINPDYPEPKRHLKNLVSDQKISVSICKKIKRDLMSP